MNIVLIFIGIVLIVINYRAINGERKSFSGVLKNQDNISKDYDIELMAIRKDMAESILDLQKEIRELREKIVEEENLEINSIKNMNILDDKIEETININNTISEDIISEINFNNIKTNDNSIEETINIENNDKYNNMELVKNMIKLGHSDDEICKELNVGKGEVLLVRRLFK